VKPTDGDVVQAKEKLLIVSICCSSGRLPMVTLEPMAADRRMCEPDVAANMLSEGSVTVKPVQFSPL